MNKNASSVRKCGNQDFTELFRWILYNHALSWGARGLAFALLDSPVNKDPKNAVLARKLKSSPSQVSVWRKELKRQKMFIREEIKKK